MNPRTLTVRVKCPRCGNPMEVQATVSGEKRDRDVEAETPVQHMGCDPYTAQEIEHLGNRIYDDAIDADHQAQREEDGPSDHELPTFDEALAASIDARGGR